MAYSSLKESHIFHLFISFEYDKIRFIIFLQVSVSYYLVSQDTMMGLILNLYG